MRYAHHNPERAVCPSQSGKIGNAVALADERSEAIPWNLIGQVDLRHLAMRRRIRWVYCAGAVKMHGQSRVEQAILRGAHQPASVNPWYEAPGVREVVVIFLSEMLAQQPFLGVDTREDGNQEKQGDQHAQGRSESERPADR